MIFNNGLKRNIWLFLLIVDLIFAIDRTIRFFYGSVDGAQVLATLVLAYICFRFYRAYSSQVKKGNVDGEINP